MNRFFLAFIFLLSFQTCAFSNTEDFLADSIDKSSVSAPKTNLNYNYESFKNIPVELRITEKISTRGGNLYEGKKLKFKVQRTASYRGVPLFKQGDIVYGKIKYITPSGMNGIPYSIVLGDFEFSGIDSNKMKDEYTKSGFNRTYFVLPLKWALTFLPPTGSLTNFIKGGHAKITPGDKIVLLYYPEWE